MADVTCAASAKSFLACLLAELSQKRKELLLRACPGRCCQPGEIRILLLFAKLKTHVFVYSGVSACQQVL